MGVTAQLASPALRSQPERSSAWGIPEQQAVEEDKGERSAAEVNGLSALDDRRHHEDEEPHEESGQATQPPHRRDEASAGMEVSSADRAELPAGHSESHGDGVVFALPPRHDQADDDDNGLHREQQAQADDEPRMLDPRRSSLHPTSGRQPGPVVDRINRLPR